ncbi:MAG: AAA family ATPase, partial [Spirochaetaceae bacterium]
MKLDLDTLTPKEIVKELDKYIVGQEKAKKVVAIALRNRVRRRMLPEELQEEIAPKNIIMIGSTGVGKTEIARRLSRLSGAPFVKVEATKYTEVGYVGRDVESMVRDLMSTALAMVKKELFEGVREDAEKRSEEVILDLLLPGVKQRQDSPDFSGQTTHEPEVSPEEKKAIPMDEGDRQQTSPTREKFRKMLKEGKLDDKEVEVSVSRKSSPSI